MINDLFRTYKKIILLLLVLLCSVVFWFYGCRHQQRSQSEVVEWNKKTIKGTNGYCYKFKTSNCTGTVTFGAAGYVAKDKEMPVTLDIFAAEKDFTGVMKVTLPGENGKGIAYQSAVKCKAGEKEKIVLNVPQLGDPSAICFEIMDSFGVTELSEDVSFSDAKNRNGAFSEQAENLIGVLSGQSKELSYLNSLKIGEESDEESVKVVCYSKNSFPQTEEEFQGLDGMIIDSFDTKSLSGKQKSALKSWLKSGGKLLIAGGDQQIDSFEGLEKTFGIIQEDVVVSELYLADADNTVQELPILMSNLQLSQKYEWEAYGDFEPEIGYTAAVGSGKISILRFSLTNSAFLQWSVRDKAAVEILSHFMGKDEDTESSDTSLWYVKKALYAFMKSQLPNTFFYGVFFIFYILLMVTIAYYYLCKIKKREYIWIIVPVGMIIGFFIVRAEPAVYVLNKQVEEITDGAISAKAMGWSLSIGVAISIGIAMLRVLTGVSILYFLIIGYGIALGLSFFVPKIFTAIAFDSGGVASGPMTATFLLPLAQGACIALGGNIVTDAFGVVAMVAMTPLITIQILGMAYKIKMCSKKPTVSEPVLMFEQLDDDAIIEL